MAPQWDRRQFLGSTVGMGALAALGDLSFLRGLRPVAAEEARIEPGHVQLRPEIEALVRLLEETPREKLLEAVAGEIRRGESYRRLLAALMLAGVRNIKPRPVGFKFHAVLVVNSAHLASLASPEGDRWLPLFWALDNFKSSQAANAREGGWVLPAVSESALPPANQARRRFVEAMDRWDEAGADAAVAQLARVAGAGEIFELFWRYGARDFRDIGHKAIYVANSWRTLQVIGWEHAEPILRSLAFALLARGNGNPAQADEPADRPWRHNLERVKQAPEAWAAGKSDTGATAELLATLRSGSPVEASEQVMALLNRGIGAASLWDGILCGAGELLARKPGLVGIHCVTSANALHFASQMSGSDETRLLLLLQAAAFLTMFRESMGSLAEVRLDAWKPVELKSAGPAAIEEIFAEVSRDRTTAAYKTLAYLQAGGSPQALMTAARRLIFLKGHDAHDYKFSAAALEDYAHVSPDWRNLYLATSMFNLRGSAEKDNPLATRTRAAIQG